MKQIPRNSDIDARLIAAFGPDAALDDLVVFEAVAVNDMPLRKTSGIYRKARISASTMIAMAEALRAESVPLQVQHNTSDLPIGRVFSGEYMPQEDKLQVLFAMNGKTQAALVSDVNSGVVDQVSVGIMAAKVLCSECGFDYMGPEADWENWYDLTCNEGHKIGVDGTHVVMSGLESWVEMSLVGKGAVNGARIVSPSQSVFSRNPNAERLAASAGGGSKLVCQTIEPVVGSPQMDIKDFVAELAKFSATAAEANVKLTAAEGLVTSLRAELADLRTQLEAAKQAAKPPASEADLSAAVAALSEIARKSCIALGEQSPTIPTDVPSLLALITDKQTKLSATIPTGARSEPATETKAQGAEFGLGDVSRAFRTVR